MVRSNQSDVQIPCDTIRPMQPSERGTADVKRRESYRGILFVKTPPRLQDTPQAGPASSQMIGAGGGPSGRFPPPALVRQGSSHVKGLLAFTIWCRLVFCYDSARLRSCSSPPENDARFCPLAKSARLSPPITVTGKFANHATSRRSGLGKNSPAQTQTLLPPTAASSVARYPP